MHENHKNEQYFFDEETKQKLALFLNNYERVCCLCTPSLGEKLEKSHHNYSLLDIDNRFQEANNFIHYDIRNPKWLDSTFDIIICDPPFFNISLSVLFKAIRLLSHHNFEQKLMISYLSRRADNVINTFSKFHLTRSGYHPVYQTVQKSERNDIEFFSNFEIVI